MNPDCPNCSKEDFCPEHKLEYLRYEANKACKAYLEELKNQSRKEPENAKCK